MVVKNSPYIYVPPNNSGHTYYHETAHPNIPPTQCRKVTANEYFTAVVILSVVFVIALVARIYDF
jgi:hypothetical protein